MNTTPPDAPSDQRPSGGSDEHRPDEGPRVSRDEVRDLGRLRRSLSDRKVAGVAGGLGRHLDVDPLVLRVAFVVLAFFGGCGLILYGACWLLVPEEGSDEATVNLDDRSRGVALIVVGVVAVATLIGGAWDSHWFPWPLVAVGVVALLLLTRKDRGHPTAPGYAPATPPYGEAAAAYGPAAPPYEQATATQASYAAPAWTPPPAPRNPRRRGPILFGLTLALIALGVGVLGIVDVAGAHVAASAYPATALGITAVMLLVGSVWGRAGGLILLGFVCTFATIGTTLGDKIDGDTLTARPVTAAAVSGDYRIDAGELILDLSKVSDLDNLDGRVIHVSADLGRVEVLVPRRGLDVDVTADINGPGGYELFGRTGGGIDEHLTETHDGGRHVPTVTIDAGIDVGQITVQEK